MALILLGFALPNPAAARAMDLPVPTFIPGTPDVVFEAPIAEATLPAVGDGTPSENAALLRNLLQNGDIQHRLLDSRETRLTWNDLVRFYRGRGYEPAWLSRGRYPMARDLLDAVAGAEDHGLDLAAYPLGELSRALDENVPGEIENKLEFDVFLTHLFLTYGRHLGQGRIDPTSLEDEEWHLPRNRFDYAGTLQNALVANQVGAALAALAPHDPEYRALQMELARLREDSVRGWPEIPKMRKAALGDTASGLREVRVFLGTVGDLPPGPAADPEVFDPQLEQGVQAFQRHHGLKADGVIGPHTLAQMRVPPAERLRTVLYNLERRRWMPRSLGTDYAYVNVPNYELRIFEGGETALVLRTITGAKDTPTPTFQDEIEYMELNPDWHVPMSIASEELLPKIQEDPAYLASQNIDVLDAEGAVVHPDSISWTGVLPESLGYRFRQAPGSLNPLGSIKFLFPNPYSVYLHDTNNTRLFEREDRALSHGCVRTEKPLTLATYLLRNDPRWPREEIEAKVQTGKRSQIRLQKPLPIVLVYLTAFLEEDGKVGYRQDVYERDARLGEALAEYRSPYQLPEGLTAGLLRGPVEDGVQ